MPETPESFQGWAIVEVMGHKRFAGYVSEQTIAGGALVRVDVPATEADSRGEATQAYTKLIGVGSIYCISPCSEDVARRAAREIERWNDPIPVSLPRLAARAVVDVEESDEDEDEDDDDDGDDELTEDALTGLYRSGP